jgi:cold shock CspA family protein
MNKIPHPTREIAHFIAKIVAARQTTSEELPYLVASVRAAIEALEAGTAREALPQAPQPAVAEPPEHRRTRRPRAAAEPAQRVHRDSEPPPAPVMPQLMRRAQVAPASAQIEARPMRNGTLRGIVRWFDLTTRQGTVRLPGFGDELTIDGAALERAGISRLYKGQEIEATVAADNDGVRLVGLALPGRAQPGSHGVFKAGTVRRNAKPVVVELKRDAMRRAASRIEAEHMLGGGRLEPGD